MRVGVNAYFWGREGVGTGQYTHQLFGELQQLFPADEYLLFAMLGGDQPQVSEYGVTRAMMPPMWLKPPTGLPSNLAKLWFEQATFPRACSRSSTDLVHVPYFAPPLKRAAKTVVTVHDVIPWVLPDYRRSVLVRMYMALVAAGARRADVIITDSCCSKADIEHYLHVPASRIRVIPLAADPSCRPVNDGTELERVRAKYGLPEQYLLYLGGFDQRKNVGSLLRAYARTVQELGGAAPPLVVAGRLPRQESSLFPNPRRIATHLGIDGHVVFPGWIDEEDKPAVYAGAQFFIFLSLYEGFGLMALEALACGTPVIAANSSSLAEVVGLGGILVDPLDLDAAAHAMTVLLRDEPLRQTLSKEAIRQADQFSWRRTAEATRQVYGEAAVAVAP